MSTLRCINGVLVVVSLFAWGPAAASAALVHHYTFDQTSGTVATDIGTMPANGTLGTNTGTPATPFTFDDNSVAGQVGGALNFQAAENDVVILPDGTLAMGTSDFTIAMWTKRNEVGDEIEGLWGQESSANRAAGSAWARIEGGDVRFLVDHGDTFTEVWAGGLATTDWTHLAFVRRGDQIEIWVNGVGTVGVDSLPANYNIDGSTGAAIGRYVSGNALTFNGAIDDVRVYNTALSEQEIGALVPEPSSSLLLTIGLAGLWVGGLRRRK